MKSKRLALLCGVVFLAIISFLLWKNDFRAIGPGYKPGGSVDKQQFDSWRTGWESQRQQ